MFSIWLVALGLILTAPAWAALSAAEAAQVRADLEGDIVTLIGQYQLADALDRDGIGRSDAKTSGDLGWGEAGYLRRYMMCWHITHDPYWLDKVIDHFDRMIGNLSDHDGDGLLSWQDKSYSVGLVDIARLSEQGEGLTVATAGGDQRVYVGRGGENITGHEYMLEFVTPDRFRFTDQTTGQLLGEVQYTDPTTCELMPGSKLKVSGRGVAGARFLIKTTAPQACEYQVHDGMVTFPIALFIEAVHRTGGLDPKYRAKADEYLKLLDQHFIPRWEKTWRPITADAGVYLFTDDPTQRFPGYSLPHNQYLAPARTLLVLGQLESYAGAQLCADRARMMANYFHDNLRLTEAGAYVWNYWDPLEHEEGIKRSVEDCAHATIDISFAAEATRRGVVFSDVDMERFARTWVDVMWDGNEQRPRFGKRVDGNAGEQLCWYEWVQTAEWDLRAWQLAMAVFASEGRSPVMAVSLLDVYARIAGVPDQVRAECRANTPKVLALLQSEGVLNTGFEVAFPGTTLPLGWSPFLWSNTDPASSIALSDQAHSGAHAVALTGVGEKVNMGVQSQRTIAVSPPAKLVLSVWYRAQAGSRPHLSVTATNAEGERVQYDSSPVFAPTEQWQQAGWEVELHPQARWAQIFLRNGGPGTVLYDDVELTVH